MGQEPLGRDMRQDRRSQEETAQGDKEHQDGTGGPGTGHKVTDGTWDNEDGMGHEVPGGDTRHQDGTGGGTGGVRMGQEELRRDRSHQDVTHQSLRWDMRHQDGPQGDRMGHGAPGWDRSH